MTLQTLIQEGMYVPGTHKPEYNPYIGDFPTKKNYELPGWKPAFNFDDIGMLCYGPMKVIDMPASGAQIHIHEGVNQHSHFKTYDQTRIPLNSYDAAMADHYAQNIGLNRYDRYIN